MTAWSTWRLEEVSPGNLQAGLAAAVLIGFLYCFLGYRLFKFILGLTGFLLAGGVALALAGWLSQGNLAAMALGLVLGGACGAMALFFLYRAGVFFLGFLGVLLVAYHVLHGRPEPWAPWAVAGLGLAGGIAALLIERPAMTLATAAIGAWLAVFAAALLAFQAGMQERLTRVDVPFPLAWGLLAAWLVLTLLGAFVQFRLAKGGGRKPSGG